ncbi:hypothetical protein PsorP6_012534 [Peronosclerospora sorghi]|uniref:Uncharacterized protein n=1 Tax=Peronosclerospora sorghi TaxID=230839 RepID=A0ACC0WK26_9STRA|nr:hypothetical protein PsorP6_012534 [Peronosclerospora sorghi]
MRNQVPRPRKATVPDNKASNTPPPPHENEVPLEPMYHVDRNCIWFSKYRSIRLVKFRDNPCGIKEGTKIFFRDVYAVTKSDRTVLRKTATHYVSLRIRWTAYYAVETAYPLLPWMERCCECSQCLENEHPAAKETVRCLRSRRDTHSGCLAIYFDEKKTQNDKVKRYESHK